MKELEKMSPMEVIFERIFLDLYEIKCHIANDHPFEAGVALGQLINNILSRKEQASNEKVQEKESRKECEKSSNEEDGKNQDNQGGEDSYFLQYLKEKKSSEQYYNSLLDLQDLIMNLLKHAKIDPSEITNILHLLINSGVTKADIAVTCGLKMGGYAE